LETQNGSDIDKVINYSLPTNKDNFTPILTIQKVESNLCQKYGRLTLKGSFDQDNLKEYDFDLTLSYPTTSLKCTAPRVSKNTETTILCRIQKEFSDSSKLLIEQTTIKKKNKEILLIKGFKSEDSLSCNDYNKVKSESAEKKKNSKYTFIQMNNFKPTAQQAAFNLFIYSIEAFSKTKSIIVTVLLNINRNRIRYRLRHLEEVEVEAECTPDKEYGVGNVKLECKTVGNNDFRKAEGLNIESDVISGIPDTADPAKTDIEIIEGLVPNYNKEEVFNKVLPFIDEAEINGDSCGTNGLFSIKGKASEKIEKNDNITNFDIEIASPSGSSFCNISSSDDDKNVELICGSKNDFELNHVSIERQTVKKDNITLFILNNVASTEPFTCIINSNYDVNEIPKIGNDTDTNRGNNTNGGNDDGDDNGKENNTIKNKYNYKKGSSGLSGGAIAAIVIVCVVAVIASAIVFVLIKSGKILAKKPNYETSTFENSSTNANVYTN
jgi:hypothetical protein